MKAPRGAPTSPATLLLAAATLGSTDRRPQLRTVLLAERATVSWEQARAGEDGLAGLPEQPPSDYSGHVETLKPEESISKAVFAKWLVAKLPELCTDTLS